MSASQESVSHWPAADDDASGHDYHCCHSVAFHNRADPGQNCHCLSLVLLHSIDYQTLRYRMAENLPIRNVPSPVQDTDCVAGSRDRFRAKS